MLCLACALSSAQGSARTVLPSQDLLDATELVTKSDAVLQGFQEDPNMKWFQENIRTARGIFIAPQMLRGAFLIGSSSGSGVFFARDPAKEQKDQWSYPGFYGIDSVSMGFQIGADASEIILLVLTEQGLKALLAPEFEINSNAVSAGPIGAGPPLDSTDILAYARSMMGIISGVSLTGAVITPRRGLNDAYYAVYNRPVSLEDILLHQVVSNSQAESLRRRIAIGTGESTAL